MKRSVMKSILCSLLIAALLCVNVSALAASKVGYLLKVSVPDSKGTYMRSTTDPHNLQHGSKDTVVASLKNGTKVLYWGVSSGDMLKVITASGKVGYIYKGNLKTYGAMNVKQLYVTSASTGIYKRSGSSLRKAGTAKKGLPVIVYSMRGGWAYVRNLSGKTGYIKTSALKKLA